jgi:hypothetical protein
MLSISLGVLLALALLLILTRVVSYALEVEFQSRKHGHADPMATICAEQKRGLFLAALADAGTSVGELVISEARAMAGMTSAKGRSHTFDARVDGYVCGEAVGADSLGAIELRNQLQSAAGASARLPSTLIFQHPPARGLAKFFVVEAPMGVRVAPTSAVILETALELLQSAGGASARLPSTLVFDHPTARELAEFFGVESPMPMADGARLAQKDGGVSLTCAKTVLTIYQGAIG